MVKSKHSLHKSLFFIFISLVLLTVLVLNTLGSASAATFSDSSFDKIWPQSDASGAAGEANRSWRWGQTGWMGDEGYDQANPNGNRRVEYLDKSRMEIND